MKTAILSLLLTVSLVSTLSAFSSMDALDAAAVFKFGIMSDNKGIGPEDPHMRRCGEWVKSLDFVLGLGDHLKSAPDPFLDFIKNDSYWKEHFYPNIADGENDHWGSQGDWGVGKKIFEYVDDFWGRDNVTGQGNGVDYYAVWDRQGFTIHVLSLHFSDSGPGLKEESRVFMVNTLKGIEKTEKDVVVVLAHSSSGNFLDALNEERKNIVLDHADFVCSATNHTFQRYTYPSHPNGALVMNSGSVGFSPVVEGYVELHVLDNPPRLSAKYVSTHHLERRFTKSVNATPMLIKEINGPTYEVPWKLPEPDPSKNLIANGSFEDGSGGSADAWNQGSKFQRSSDRAVSGSYSMKSNFMNVSGGMDTRIPVTVEPHTKYIVSAWLYKETPDGTGVLDVIGAQDLLRPEVHGTRGDGYWSYLTAGFNSGSNTEVTVRVLVESNASAPYWFDDVTLYAESDYPVPVGESEKYFTHTFKTGDLKVDAHVSAGERQVEFTVSQEARVQLSLHDNSGRLLRNVYSARTKPGVHQISFETGSYPSGIYYLRGYAGINQAAEKFVILH